MTIKQGSTVRLVSDAEEIMVGQGFGWNPEIMKSLEGKSFRVVYIPTTVGPTTLVTVTLEGSRWQVPLQVLTQVESDDKPFVQGDLVRLRSVPPFVRAPYGSDRIHVYHGLFSRSFGDCAQVKLLDDDSAPFLVVPLIALVRIDRMDVVVRLDYYKVSGKWYSDGTITLEDIQILQGGTPYLPDILDRVKKMREVSTLPGLSTNWAEGFVLVRCVKPEGNSHLLPPVRS
jgi:hypothetical protein